jgi:hypothetical protein
LIDFIWYLGGAKNVQQDRKKISKYRKNLIFRQIRLDEFGKYLHCTVYRGRGFGREEVNEES